MPSFLGIALFSADHSHVGRIRRIGGRRALAQWRHRVGRSCRHSMLSMERSTSRVYGCVSHHRKKHASNRGRLKRPMISHEKHKKTRRGISLPSRSYSRASSCFSWPSSARAVCPQTLCVLRCSAVKSIADRRAAESAEILKFKNPIIGHKEREKARRRTASCHFLLVPLRVFCGHRLFS